MRISQSANTAGDDPGNNYCFNVGSVVGTSVDGSLAARILCGTGAGIYSTARIG